MDIEKTIRALTGRGFAVQHFATGREAADYLDGAIDGTTVGIGGSKTIDQLGLYDRLTKHNTVWWHWRTPGFDTLDHALTAPVYNMFMQWRHFQNTVAEVMQGKS